MLKTFGGPEGIRTLDLFHAIYKYQRSPVRGNTKYEGAGVLSESMHLWDQQDVREIGSASEANTVNAPRFKVSIITLAKFRVMAWGRPLPSPK